MILRRAGQLTGIDTGVGLLLSFGMAHGAVSMLFGVSPDDPLVFGCITAAIAFVAVSSSWISAHRASCIDPMAALRDD
jgi:ABC-type antimicrobial peptide transport system permease subunit